jgi:RNA polymerase sigma-70 factor (ECF subfamily)
MPTRAGLAGNASFTIQLRDCRVILDVASEETRPGSSVPTLDSAFSGEVTSLLHGVMPGREEDCNKLYDLTVRRVAGLALRILRHEADAQEVALDVYARLQRRSVPYDSSRGHA